VQTSASGTAYNAWFEIFPDQPAWTTVPITVSPGDVMFAAVYALQSSSIVFIEDTTTGAYDNVNPAATAAGCICATAEAIEEDPSFPPPTAGTGGIVPFAFVNWLHFLYVGMTASDGVSNYISNEPAFNLNATDVYNNVMAQPTTFLPGAGGYFGIYRYPID
jgi:hypothetical protein